MIFINPTPFPPNMQFSIIFHKGIIPAIGVKESCMLLTLPVVKDVVISVNKIEAMRPNLISLPSILIPFIPYCENNGTPCFSK